MINDRATSSSFIVSLVCVVVHLISSVLASSDVFHHRPQDIPHQTETLRHQEGAISVETAVTAPAQVVTHNNVANQLQENTPTYVNFGQAEYEPMDYVKEEKQVTFNDASNYGNVYELDDDSCVEEDHYKVPRSIAKW